MNHAKPRPSRVVEGPGALHAPRVDLADAIDPSRVHPSSASTVCTCYHNGRELHTGDDMASKPSAT